MELLTRSEELILLAVWNLQAEAYGAAIQAHLTKVTGRDWSFGAIYIPLERLEARGYVRSMKQEPTVKRRGRRKRYFTLTKAGVAALSHMRHIQNTLWEGLGPLALDGGEG